jgi:hypothetical protein
MQYQISFHRLGRIHQVSCDNQMTALILYDTLRCQTSNSDIEVLENPNCENAKWVHEEFEREINADA